MANGKFPDQPGDTSGTNATVGVASTYVSTAEGVVILSEIGISMTETVLAQRLAAIGALAALDGPLPVADFIALVTGVIIVGDYVVNQLSANRTAVVNYIGQYVGTTYSSNANTSIIASANITQYVSQGYRHFAAWRYNGAGGGITVGGPLNYSNAVARLASADVYSPLPGDAYKVADGASFGSWPIWDSAHNTSNQPNNRPHWHATILFVKQNPHSFE